MRTVGEVELRAPQPLVHRDARRVVGVGRDQVVDAVVKERDVRYLAAVEAAQQDDRRLGADIAELTVIRHLGAITPLMQQFAQVRGNRVVIPRAGAP